MGLGCLARPGIVWAGDETIVVHGIGKAVIDRDVRALVDVPRRHQASRWTGPICVEIVGLRAEYASALVGHLRAAAQPLGVEVRERCDESNVVVVATDRSDEVMNAVIRKMPRLARGYDASSANDLNFQWPRPYEIAALRVKRPVRWFSATSIEPPGGARSSGVLSGDNDTFLGVPTVERTTFEMVVIDVSLCGVRLDALSDYVAMVILARPRMDAVFGRESIMGVFRAGPDMTGMTGLDRAVLQGLYRADPQQEGRDEQDGIVRAVERDAGRF